MKPFLLSEEFIELQPSASLIIDLKYASDDNFVGQNVYGDFNKAYLHQHAAQKFSLAREILKAINSNYKFIVFDALRPRSAQYVLWDKVKGTPQESYIANPVGGSVHNYGFAIDLSIIDENGKELDMGTAFDDLSALSQPQLELEFFKAGQLTQKQINNRALLRKVMEDGGFIQLPHEWWHFDALPKTEVKEKYKIVE